MYVTVARLPGRHITACATPTATDATSLPDRTAALCTARVCRPEQVGRTTGAIRPVDRILTVDRSLAVVIAATAPAADLAGPVVGFLVHLGIGRLVAVGPFNDPTDLDRWWDWHVNRFVTAGIVYVPAALTTASAEDGERR